MKWLLYSGLLLILVGGCSAPPEPTLQAGYHRDILGPHLQVADDPLSQATAIPRSLPERPPMLSESMQGLVMRHVFEEMASLQQRYYALLYYLTTQDPTLFLEEFADE